MNNEQSPMTATEMAASLDKHFEEAAKAWAEKCFPIFECICKSYLKAVSEILKAEEEKP